MNKQIGGRWYTRRNGRISGPFAAGLVSRNILLGRLSLEDELSNDKETWLLVSKVPELIPEVMKGDQDDPFVQERLLAAQRWADERLQTDRRVGEAPSEAKKWNRRAGDRRDNELDDVLEHRGVLRKRRLGINSENTFLGWILLLLILGGIGWVGNYAYENRVEEVVVDCQSPAVPNANWQNCILPGSKLNAVDLSNANLRNANLSNVEMQSATLVKANADFSNMSLGKLANSNFNQVSMLGTNLRGADLRDANFENANLSFANLTGANIAGVNLQGANLHKAIWIDGTTCAEGSVSACAKP